MPTKRLELDAHDRKVLTFAAEHRRVLGRQIERLLGQERVSGRLKRLVDAELLGFGEGFPHVQIRAAGLALIGSDLPVPRVSLVGYKHDIGLGWLWLAAHAGLFGSLSRVVSERRMRSHDGVLDRPDQPYGIRLGGVDRAGNEQLHHPDLLLIDRRGRRLALELELTGKGRERRELILGSYGCDQRIDRVLYLVQADRAGRALGRLIKASISDLGLSERAGVQLVRPFAGTPDDTPRASERRLRSVRSTAQMGPRGEACR